MVTFREATLEDVDALASLVTRLKRLNEEFDPLLKAREDSVEVARKYLKEAIESGKSIILVAEEAGKIFGILKSDLIERCFYEPKLEGRIIELYIMPEFRRKGIGRQFIEEAVKKLREKGAQLITAEFPSLNKIAVNFYEKLGFRPVINIYAKEL